MREITVRAPATVSNVVCGFDCLGFALTEPFDAVTVRETSHPGLQIVTHGDFELPEDPEKNVAGVAVAAMLKAAGYDSGIEIELQKNIKPGSGIGSSAASSCGAVVATNVILDNRFSRHELIDFAMEGERFASGEKSI